jgi:outer membrane protein assembly factor BamD (BamD/ComL family)
VLGELPRRAQWALLRVGFVDERLAPRGSAAAGNQLKAERALLDVARGALEGEDGAAALAATAQHERKFPNGALVQEREAMAVRALMLLGRAAEARARAERFRTRFPESPLLPTIQSAIGARSVP